ncbi:Methylenetetrahydrofolate reductase [Seminavis robusta]|uniref:Methylenetetrahydrofolate reductase n=1 Tax=Seminavis robusta TaxID=568900 RepID=A0A9N8DRB6_9STRA|nr:Methylenetetrahydrofolate reductase [Seminavis robusta]|eukprot:Sro299_g111540.1 Methylenetetrahydrofolate reductase (413) ;mRNA; f:73904-75408
MAAITPDRKIIDILNEKKAAGVKTCLSLEYFPPRTEEGVKNLYARMDRMKGALSPLFTDMTWGAGGSTADLSLELALHAQKTGHVSNLHMTCTNIQAKEGEEDVDPKKAIHDALQAALDGGIRNIVALRGDPPAGEEEWKASEGGFACALDLVKYMREHFGQEFGISVAGYPEGHPNAISEVADPSTLTEAEKARSSSFDGKTYCCLDADYKKEMDYLKEKVDAGSDLIITQMFFDVEVFKTFVKDCRKWGINCPVVPGLMCINAYGGFKKMTKFCKTRVPADLDAKMDSIKDDAAAVKEFGVEFGVKVCQDLMDSGLIEVLHFYTLNLEKVVYGILDQLKLSDNALALVNEKDAASMVAKGSAWARVGDEVTCEHGKGVVDELLPDGSAVIVISGKDDKVTMAKGAYQKVF